MCPFRGGADDPLVGHHLRVVRRERYSANCSGVSWKVGGNTVPNFMENSPRSQVRVGTGIPSPMTGIGGSGRGFPLASPDTVGRLARPGTYILPEASMDRPAVSYPIEAFARGPEGGGGETMDIPRRAR